MEKIGVKRLFIAAEIPEEIKDAIEWEILSVKKFFPTWIKLTPRENWHLTISFLGDQEEEKVGTIETAIKEIISEFYPPTVKFTRLHFGPNEENPRMLWVFGESAGLADLKRKIDRRLKKAGIFPEKNNTHFSCHLTLARLGENRFHFPPRALNGFFHASSVVLEESILKRDGAEHRVIKKFSFGQLIPKKDKEDYNE